MPITFDLNFFGTGAPSGSFTVDDAAPFGTAPFQFVSNLTSFSVSLTDGTATWTEANFLSNPAIFFSGTGMPTHVTFFFNSSSTAPYQLRVNPDTTWLTSAGNGRYGISAATTPPTTVPEPSTVVLLLGAGLAGLAFALRRRRVKAWAISAA
jgi:hypothetical protein